MKGQRQPINAREVLDAHLRSRNMRRTVERYAILDYVESTTHQFTADDVAAALDGTQTQVATSTIYATLQLLEECGILRRFCLMGGAWHYSRVGVTAPRRRVFLVCDNCGKVREVRDAELTRIVGARRWPSFTPTDYTLTVKGLCTACQRRQLSFGRDNKKQTLHNTTNNQGKKK